MLIIITSDPLIPKLLSQEKLIRFIGKSDLKIIKEKGPFPKIRTKTYIMSLRDVYLNYSYYSALNLLRPVSGQKCFLNTKDPQNFYFQDSNDNRLEQLSKSFTRMLKESYKNGWRIEDIEIDSIVYWQDRKHDIWLPHVLCRILEKYN